MLELMGSLQELARLLVVKLDGVQQLISEGRLVSGIAFGLGFNERANHSIG